MAGSTGRLAARSRPSSSRSCSRPDETLELFDFGTPVSVDSPPRKDVEDVTELVAKEAK